MDQLNNRTCVGAYMMKRMDQRTRYNGGQGHRVLVMCFRNDSVLVTLCGSEGDPFVAGRKGTRKHKGQGASTLCVCVCMCEGRRRGVCVCMCVCEMWSDVL